MRVWCHGGSRVNFHPPAPLPRSTNADLRPIVSCSNQLYVKADVLFCASAFLYLFGSLRDVGFFFWVPLVGCKSLAVLEEEDAAAGRAGAGGAGVAALGHSGAAATVAKYQDVPGDAEGFQKV